MCCEPTANCVPIWYRFWSNNKSRMYLLENTRKFLFICKSVKMSWQFFLLRPVLNFVEK